ncbi:MAG: hypothetical protein AB7U92_18640 [Piscinibacter sp.]|uniref:hypothetical protein n=1 Tax=Piscinibacter sp. TaxID=1903157 RepID=UPI003D09704D
MAAIVMLLHLTLLAWWMHADRRERATAGEVPRVSVRLIAAAPPRPALAEAPAPRAAPARVRRPAPARRPLPAPPVPAALEPQPITVAAPEPAASQPLAGPAPSLMDGEATRRAIRAAAREPGLATQAGRQGPALQTPDERLGERVQRSAKGDCLKGEYLGGGMGLLSLPFLAAAALRDQCRR